MINLSYSVQGDTLNQAKISVKSFFELGAYLGRTREILRAYPRPNVVDGTGTTAVFPFEEGAVMELPAVTRRYEVVTHPDRPFVIDDMQNVVPTRPLPQLYILRARTGDHIGKAAGAAPQTFNPAVIRIVPAHRNILCPYRTPVKVISLHVLSGNCAENGLSAQFPLE